MTFKNPIKQLSPEQVATLPNGVWKDLLSKNDGVLPDIRDDFEYDGEKHYKLDPQKYHDAQEAVEKAAYKAGIPTPNVFIWDTDDFTAQIINYNGVVAFSKKMTILPGEALTTIALHEIGHGFQGKLDNKYDKYLKIVAGSRITQVVSGGIGIIDLLKNQTLSPVAITSGFALLASTALFAYSMFKARDINHKKEFDADGFAIDTSDNPQRAAMGLYFIIGGNNEKPEITNLTEAVRRILDNPPLSAEYLKDTHPYDEDREAHAQKVVKERRKREGGDREI